MGIFPDPEYRQRPVDACRHKREKEPDTRERFDIVDRAPKRIRQKPGDQAEIDAEATRAHSKLLTGDEKGTFGDLVTNE